MLFVPRGIEKRWQRCLYTSRPIAAWCCGHTVAAAADVVLTRMYLRLLANCIQRSASAVGEDKGHFGRRPTFSKRSRVFQGPYTMV